MNQPPSINLNNLLSTLSDACSRGCQVIQFVNHKRLQQSNSSDGTNLNVQYKIADDPRSALTEADINSQLVIVDCIRSVYGNELNIIGEEDEDDQEPQEGEKEASSKEDVSKVFGRYNVDTVQKRSIDSSFFSNNFKQEIDAVVSIKEVTIYIDPLDGTREFVEGRLGNVQCLIGITYKGKPIGGVIGLPFVSLDDKDSNEGINIVCALHSETCQIIERIQFKNGTFCQLPKDARSWQSIEQQDTIHEEKAPLKVFTGDSKRLHRDHALLYLKKIIKESGNTAHPMKLCIEGGCGNKILRSAAYASLSPMNHNAISVIPPGTCSWDTAAPTSILFAAMDKFGFKAKVTDMFGGELVYNSSGKVVTNDLGVFVSCGEEAVQYHELLVKAMRSNTIILDSLLHNYWEDFGGCDGKGKYWNNFGDCEDERDRDEVPTQLELKIAQLTGEQSVHTMRNNKGYVMKCSEVQALMSDEIDLDGAKLIGYAMPSEKADVLQLFWRYTSEYPEKEMPDEAHVQKEGGTIVRLSVR